MNGIFKSSSPNPTPVKVKVSFMADFSRMGMPTISQYIVWLRVSDLGDL